MDDKHYIYQVMPCWGVSGYQTVRRRYRQPWRVVKEIPRRMNKEDAARDLASYGEERGMERV